MMRRMLAVMTLAACTQAAPYRATTMRFEDVRDADLFSASVRVLGERGHGLRSKDREAGVLVTDWEDVNFGIGRVRHAWRAIVGDGALRLMIDCEVVQANGPFETGERWGKCTNTHRHPDWVNAMPEIQSQISDEAIRLAKKPGDDTTDAMRRDE